MRWFNHYTYCQTPGTCKSSLDTFEDWAKGLGFKRTWRAFPGALSLPISGIAWIISYHCYIKGTHHKSAYGEDKITNIDEWCNGMQFIYLLCIFIPNIDYTQYILYENRTLKENAYNLGNFDCIHTSWHTKLFVIFLAIHAVRYFVKLCHHFYALIVTYFPEDFKLFMATIWQKTPPHFFM